MCGICSAGYILSGSKCIESASGRAVASLITPILVLSAVIAVVLLALFSDVAKPVFQFVWMTLGTQSRILWALSQILAHTPIILSTLLPESLREFYDSLRKLTDLNPFAAFGLSCANHMLRSFETQLLVAVIAPIIVSALLCAYHVIQVFALGRDAAQCFSRYAHLQLIVLFLVLPGVSTIVFRTFLCDDDFLADTSVAYLEAGETACVAFARASLT